MVAHASKQIVQFAIPYQIVPRSPHEVLLYTEERGSFSVHLNEFDVLGLCERLSRGVSAVELESFVAASEQVRSLLAKMHDAKILRTVCNSTGLDAGILERWATQIEWFRLHETDTHSRFEMMARIRNSHVVAIGVGSLGSWALQHLASAGIGKVTLVDFDVVESSNLARQSFFRQEDVGRRKTDAAFEILRAQSAFTEIATVHLRIESVEAIRDLVRAAKPVDLIMLTADEPQWKIAPWACEAALDLGVALVRGNSRGIGPFVTGPGVACSACDWPRAREQIENAAEIVEYYRGSRRRRAGRLAISTHLAISGSLLAHEVISFLAGAEVPKSVNALVRLLEGSIPQICVEPLSKNESCEVCAGRTEIASHADLA